MSYIVLSIVVFFYIVSIYEFYIGQKELKVLEELSRRPVLDEHMDGGDNNE